MPNNRNQALRRLLQFKKRLSRDSKFREEYAVFMSDMITQGYAERVTVDQEHVADTVLYIPHHGVFTHENPNLE